MIEAAWNGSNAGNMSKKGNMRKPGDEVKTAHRRGSLMA